MPRLGWDASDRVHRRSGNGAGDLRRIHRTQRRTVVSELLPPGCGPLLIPYPSRLSTSSNWVSTPKCWPSAGPQILEQSNVVRLRETGGCDSSLTRERCLQMVCAALTAKMDATAAICDVIGSLLPEVMREATTRGAAMKFRTQKLHFIGIGGTV